MDLLAGLAEANRKENSMTKKPETSQQRLTAVQTACVHLLAARALLRSVGADEAAEYVQRGLKGAERHATRLGARPRNIVFTTTTCR